SGFFFCAARTRWASSALLSSSSLLLLLRSRKVSVPSALTVISSGATGGWADLPTLGSSTLPGWIIGAVTMKIMSRTSITSIYGTPLIWFMSLRLCLGILDAPGLLHLPLQNVRELLHEALEAHRDAIHVMGEAVVGDHGGNRRKQADGRGDERFGNPRGNGRQRGGRHRGQAAEGVHDAPHGAEQADVGGDRADRG